LVKNGIFYAEVKPARLMPGWLLFLHEGLFTRFVDHHIHAGMMLTETQQRLIVECLRTRLR